MRHPTPLAFDASGSKPSSPWTSLARWAHQRYVGTVHEMNAAEMRAYNVHQLGIEGAAKFETERAHKARAKQQNAEQTAHSAPKSAP